MRGKVILLFGPTAAGKTGLAVELAERFGGAVVNADARQIYQKMPILTAMPGAAERARVPHYGFEFLQPNQGYSVGQYLADAREHIGKIWQEGRVPLVVGGTGFYLKVLTDGISPTPSVSPEVLADFDAQWQVAPAGEMHQRLAEVDPRLAAKLPPGDKQRVIRGLAVYQQTGQCLSAWQDLPAQGGLAAQFLKLAVNPPVAQLHQRIHARLQTMVAQGVVAEVQALKDQGLALSAPGLSSLGADLFYQMLAGELSETEALSRFETQQRQYAKRQRTWLRHQYKPDLELERGEITTALLAKITEFLASELPLPGGLVTL